MPDRESYVITIRDAANHHETRPAITRLRALLKLMLRGFGLRCVEIRRTNSAAEPTEINTSEDTLLE